MQHASVWAGQKYQNRLSHCLLHVVPTGAAVVGVPALTVPALLESHDCLIDRTTGQTYCLFPLTRHKLFGLYLFVYNNFQPSGDDGNVDENRPFGVPLTATSCLQCRHHVEKTVLSHGEGYEWCDAELDRQARRNGTWYFNKCLNDHFANNRELLCCTRCNTILCRPCKRDNGETNGRRQKELQEKRKLKYGV